MTQENGAGKVIMINIGLPIMMIMPIMAVGEGAPARRTVTPPANMITGISMWALATSMRRPASAKRSRSASR